MVYQHHDSGHPHIHLVTTNIEADGKRIDLHHLGIRKSEPARKALEKEFGLVQAEAQKKDKNYQLKPIVVSKAKYGKSQTKMAIQNILENVLNPYKYTSLPELNAVLNQYNVKAERGTENSKVYQTGGLLYRVLDIDGNPVGVPIKAIQERCLPEGVSGQDLLRHPDPKQTIGLQPQTTAAAETKEADKEVQSATIPTGKENVLEVLTQAENTSDYLPNQLKKKRKKKKKRNLNNNQ